VRKCILYCSNLGVAKGYLLNSSFVPRPVHALILLFPITELYEKHRREQEEQYQPKPDPDIDNLIYFKQTVCFDLIFRGS
jgi:Ubiquitin carboxyl-terminal hydrolase, family 1